MIKQRGFTLIELLLAMTFFSFILLLVTSGFIQINRSYTRGITTKRVNNTARQIVEEITSIVRNAKASDIVTQNLVAGNLRLCVGNTRYGWNMDNGLGNLSFTTEQLSDNAAFTFVKTGSGNCDDPIVSTSADNVLNSNLMVQYLRISRIGLTNSFKVVLVISSDDEGQTSTFFSQTGVDALCRPGSGDQFCSVAKIDTVVTARN